MDHFHNFLTSFLMTQYDSCKLSLYPINFALTELVQKIFLVLYGLDRLFVCMPIELSLFLLYFQKVVQLKIGIEL